MVFDVGTSLPLVYPAAVPKDKIAAQNSYVLEHPWDTCVEGYLRRFPNHPRITVLSNSHLLSESVSHDGSVRTTIRRCVLEIEIPAILKKVLGSSKLNFIQEMKIDYKNRIMAINTANEFLVGRLEICENVMMAPDKNQGSITKFEQVASMKLPGFVPFSSVLERIAMKNYEKNLAKAKTIDLKFINELLDERKGMVITVKPRKKMKSSSILGTCALYLVVMLVLIWIEIFWDNGAISLLAQTSALVFFLYPTLKPHDSTKLHSKGEPSSSAMSSSAGPVGMAGKKSSKDKNCRKDVEAVFTKSHPLNLILSVPYGIFYTVRSESSGSHDASSESFCSTTPYIVIKVENKAARNSLHVLKSAKSFYRFYKKIRKKKTKHSDGQREHLSMAELRFPFDRGVLHGCAAMSSSKKTFLNESKLEYVRAFAHIFLGRLVKDSPDDVAADELGKFLSFVEDDDIYLREKKIALTACPRVAVALNATLWAYCYWKILDDALLLERDGYSSIAIPLAASKPSSANGTKVLSEKTTTTSSIVHFNGDISAVEDEYFERIYCFGSKTVSFGNEQNFDLIKKSLLEKEKILCVDEKISFLSINVLNRKSLHPSGYSYPEGLDSRNPVVLSAMLLQSIMSLALKNDKDSGAQKNSNSHCKGPETGGTANIGIANGKGGSTDSNNGASSPSTEDDADGSGSFVDADCDSLFCNASSLDEFEDYAVLLQKVVLFSEQDSFTWHRQDRVSFWINIYWTITLHGYLKSTNGGSDKSTSPPYYDVGGFTLSSDDIRYCLIGYDEETMGVENKMSAKDPRRHLIHSQDENIDERVFFVEENASNLLMMDRKNFFDGKMSEKDYERTFSNIASSFIKQRILIENDGSRGSSCTIKMDTSLRPFYKYCEAAYLSYYSSSKWHKRVFFKRLVVFMDEGTKRRLSSMGILKKRQAVANRRSTIVGTARSYFPWSSLSSTLFSGENQPLYDENSMDERPDGRSITMDDYRLSRNIKIVFGDIQQSCQLK